MANYTIIVPTAIEVTTLLADMQVRYWDDGKINGEPDDDDDPQMPLRSGDNWTLKINLESGQVSGWPKGIEADVHYKVCDAGFYAVLDQRGAEVASFDGYVPKMLSPGGEGFGDYVIMKIDGDGFIENWKVRLDCFEADQ